MNGTESESPSAPVAAEGSVTTHGAHAAPGPNSHETEGAFDESDGATMRIPYGDGGVPAVVTGTWVIFIACYLVAMGVLILPDLVAWIRH